MINKINIKSKSNNNIIKMIDNNVRRNNYLDAETLL